MPPLRIADIFESISGQLIEGYAVPRVPTAVKQAMSAGTYGPGGRGRTAWAPGTYGPVWLLRTSLSAHVHVPV